MATAPHIDVREIASNVVGTLDSLESYLTTVMNPNRVALTDLGMEAMGWTAKSYSPRAFEIWTKQHKLDPGDHLTLHHLAIMHHARAFDLEKGRTPAEADADWRAALDYWHRLQQSDAFWDYLAGKACADAPGRSRKDVDALRADLPALLLAIHYDLAFDEETRAHRKSRTKFHIALAQSAPFAATDRAAARAAAYAKFARAIPDHVWQQNELREEEVAKGMSVIEEFLLYDPGCPPALEDALRLQRRMQRARNLKWRSLGENDPERMRILELERKDYEHWHPYFGQLVELRTGLEESVRENLAGWYFTSGDSLAASEHREEAVTCLERAVLVCPDEDDRKKFQQRLVQNLGLLAQHKAASRAPDARKICDRVRARDDLTILGCLLLARAYLTLFTRAEDDDLQLLDLAEETCRRGLSIEPDFDELDADQYKEHFKPLQEAVQRNRLASVIRAFVKRAHEAMAAQKFADALPPLNEAEKAARAQNVLAKHNTIYWMRAQAHLGLKQFAEAQRDSEAYDALLGPTPSPQDVKAGQQLRQLIKDAIEANSIKPLLDRAKQAMDEGRFADALVPLNEAARRAPQTDVIFYLRCQAHTILQHFDDARRDLHKVEELAETDRDRQAAARLKEMIAQGEAAAVVKGLLAKAKAAMDQGKFADALEPLNDAARRAPKNDVIFYLRCQAHVILRHFDDARRDARTVAELAETDQDREAVKRLNDMIAQGEAAAAIKGLLDRARQAMERGRFADALPPLNDAAIRASNNDVVFFLRCQVHVALRDFDHARQDARRVEQLAENEQDRQAVRRLHEMIAQAEAGSLIRGLLEQAKTAMEQHRFSDALRPLDDAARRSPDTNVIYFLRAQARMATKDFMGAIADVEKFGQLAETDDDREAADRLRKGLLGLNR